ncbi:MAG: hypothetical protein Q9213_001312 [Squamulea squamosa]
MPTAVVTGADFGIGHVWVKQLLSEVGIPLTDCWDPSSMNTESRTTRSSPLTSQLVRISLLFFYANPSSAISPQTDLIIEFATHVQSLDKRLGLLLDIAGIMAPKASETLENIISSTLLQTFPTNACGPLPLTQARGPKR